MTVCRDHTALPLRHVPRRHPDLFDRSGPAADMSIKGSARGLLISAQRSANGTGMRSWMLESSDLFTWARLKRPGDKLESEGGWGWG